MDKHGVSFLLLLILFSPASFSNQNCEFEKKLPSMGSFFEIQIAADCSLKDLTPLYLEIQNILNDMESQMSLYQSNSPINKLNEQGLLLGPPSHLLNNIKLSLEIAEKTNGAFDITILPVLNLIQDSFKKTKNPPLESALNLLKNLVDYRKIEIQKSQIKFKEKNIKISLDGIAKGYAVDQVSDLLNKRGYKSFLINFSGNMRWQGKNHKNNLWKIVIWDPLNQKPVPIKLSPRGAIASSGIDYNHFSDDKKWHHIISPKTLKPSPHWVGTSITGPLAAVCDALSTATFASNIGEIKKIMLKFPEYKIWAIDPNQQVYRTTL